MKQLGQVPFPGSRQACLTLSRGNELSCRLPEQAEWATISVMVPDTRRDYTMPPRHAVHLPQPRHRVCHEMDDELGEGGVERAVLKWQILRVRSPDRDCGIAFLSRCRE